MNRDSWKAAPKLVKNGGEWPSNEGLIASDVDFTRCRIGQELNLFDTLSEFVEDGHASLDDCPPVSREFNTPSAAIQQSDAKRMFHVGYRFGYDRLRHRKLPCSFSHAAGLHHGQQNMQVPQFESAPDAIAPRHAAHS